MNKYGSLPNIIGRLSTNDVHSNINNNNGKNDNIDRSTIDNTNTNGQETSSDGLNRKSSQRVVVNRKLNKSGVGFHITSNNDSIDKYNFHSNISSINNSADDIRPSSRNRDHQSDRYTSESAPRTSGRPLLRGSYERHQSITNTHGFDLSNVQNANRYDGRSGNKDDIDSRPNSRQSDLRHSRPSSRGGLEGGKDRRNSKIKRVGSMLKNDSGERRPITPLSSDGSRNRGSSMNILSKKNLSKKRSALNNVPLLDISSASLSQLLVNDNTCDNSYFQSNKSHKSGKVKKEKTIKNGVSLSPSQLSYSLLRHDNNKNNTHNDINNVNGNDFDNNKYNDTDNMNNNDNDTYLKSNVNISIPINSIPFTGIKNRIAKVLLKNTNQAEKLNEIVQKNKDIIQYDRKKYGISNSMINMSYIDDHMNMPNVNSIIDSKNNQISPVDLSVINAAVDEGKIQHFFHTL